MRRSAKTVVWIAIIIFIAAASSLIFFKSRLQQKIPAWTVARALDHMKEAVVSGDFSAAKKLMSPSAAQRWWLDGLENIQKELPGRPQEQKTVINEMLTTYRQMLRSVRAVHAVRDGDRIRAELSMWIVIGDVQSTAFFPTLWRRRQGQWILERTEMNLEQLRDHFEDVDAHHAGVLPANGYPPPYKRTYESPTPDIKERISETPSSEQTPSPCPKDMAYVPAGEVFFRYDGHRALMSGRRNELKRVPAFCVDRYEASRPNATNQDPGQGDHHAAISLPGKIPWTSLTWQNAKEACVKAGKSLCDGLQWQRAAGGDAGLLYPGGDTLDHTQCNTYTLKHGAGAIAPTGAFPRCKSPFGVYDMCGNVSEWTDEIWQSGKEDHVIRGGSYNHNLHNDQALYPFFGWRSTGYGESVAAMHHHPPESTYPDDGFRCCKKMQSPLL